MLSKDITVINGMVRTKDSIKMKDKIVNYRGQMIDVGAGSMGDWSSICSIPGNPTNPIGAWGKTEQEAIENIKPKIDKVLSNKTKDEGKYKIYWINHNYYSQEEFNTLEEARKYADSKSFEYRIDLNGKPVASGGALRGFRMMDKKTKDTDRIEFDRLNDLIKEGRIEIDSWIGVNGNHGIAQVRGTSGKLSSLFVENIPDWFKKKYHIGDSKTKDESYTIQYKGWKINLVNRGANWEGEAFDNINMRKGMLSSEGLSSLSVQKDLQSQIDMQTQDSSKTKDINPPSESERIKNDFEAGRKDHNAGYYDKWYRWNRKDNGRAYDDGFNSVAGKPVQIIEAMHDSKTKDADLPVGKHNADPDDKFNAEELAMGIKIEMEHTDDLDIAKAIAKDHLNEVPDYYSRLTKMEEEAIEAEKVTKDEGNFLVGKRIIVNAGRFTNAPATVIEIGGQVTHGVNGVYAKMDTGEKVWVARSDFEFKDSKTKDASQAYIDGYTAARGAYHKGTNPIKNDPAKAAEWDRGWEDGKADKDELSAKGSGQEYIKYGSHFKDKKMKDGNGEQALDKCRHSLFPVANELATIASSSIYEDRIRKAAKRAERLVDEARHVLFDAV